MLPVVFLSSEFPGIPLGVLRGKQSSFTTTLLPSGKTLLERLDHVPVLERNATRALVTLLTDRLDQPTLSALKHKLPNLVLVANYAVGFNNIDIAAANRLGIAVTNTPHVLGDATADPH